MNKQQANVCVVCLCVVAFAAVFWTVTSMFIAMSGEPSTDWITIEKNGVAIDCVYTDYMPALECDWEGVTNDRRSNQ